MSFSSANRNWARIGLVMALVAALAATPGRPADAAPIPGFIQETYQPGLDLPVDIEWADGGPLFVAEKAGVVQAVQGGAATVFADLTAEVNDDGERGLLGIAAHPAFSAGSPYLYVLHTYDPPETAGQLGAAGPDGEGHRVARLTRLTADAATGYTTMVPGSAVTILGAGGDWVTTGDPSAVDRDNSPAWACGNPVYVADCLPADSPHHTIGTVMFGSDGALYVGNGDAGGFSSDPRSLRALDLDSLAGKILRIDPDTGLGLPDNPHWDGNPASNRSRIYHLGLRNPYRFTEGPTGGLWIGDVGSGSWEEIDNGPAGADFGWPCYEGGAPGTLEQNPDFAGTAVCQTYYGSNSAVAPVHSYSHAPGSAAIILGEFYTGTTWPSRFHGTLLFGDYVRSTLDAIDVSAPTPTPDPIASDLLFVAAEFGPDGHLYLASIGAGAVERIRYAPGEEPPGFLRTTTVPPVPSLISLDGVERTQWGIDWLALTPGGYVQCFSDVPGWVTPACAPLVVDTGLTTVTQGGFAQKATLVVSTRLDGTVATGIGSVISIDGEPASSWGHIVELPAGPVEVCFGPVADLGTPPCQTPVLVAGAVTAAEGVFTASPGSPGPAPSGLLRVSTTPAVPTTVEVNGVEVSQFGLEWVPTPAGAVDVCFSDVPGFVTPPCQTATVTAGATTVVNGVFDPLGTLQVFTSPPTDVSVVVDGTPRNQWGLLTTFAAGPHEICAPFPTGAVCTQATVSAGALTQVTLSPAAPPPPNQPPVADAGADIEIVDWDMDGSEPVTLDGSGSSDPDGTITAWEWREGVALLGTGPSPTVSLALGSHPIGLTITDDDGATAVDTVVVSVVAPSLPDQLAVSFSATTTVGGVTAEPEDVVLHDLGTGAWSMLFDGSDVGLPGNGGRDIDAVHLMADGSILFSTTRSGTLAGIGDFDATDIVRFVPSSVGPVTAGTFELYFDGSDVDLTSDNEDIDAIGVLPDGSLLLSTTGSPNLVGLTGLTEGSLLRFAPTSLGAITAGTWSLHLDGAAIGLGAGGESADGLSVEPLRGDLHLSTVSQFAAGAVTGTGSDVLRCADAAAAPAGGCTSHTVVWDATLSGVGPDRVDAVHVGH